MRVRHYWIEIVSLCTAIACGLALLIVLGVLGVAAVAVAQSSTASPAPTPETYEGVVTDTHCGAKHQASIRKNAADCARSCVHAGSQFALVDGDKTYILTGDSERLKDAAGRRVKVLGTLSGETIAVALITPGS
jgi:Mg-chelatase subunit ChlD